MNCRFSVLLLLCLFPLFESHSSIGIPKLKWDRLEVKVCFGDRGEKKSSPAFKEDFRSWHKSVYYGSFAEKARIRSFSLEEKTIIKNKIQEQFTKERTGIYFTGFEDCQDHVPTDVIIYAGKGGPEGAAKIGQNSKMKGYVRGRNTRTQTEVLGVVYERVENRGPSYVYLITPANILQPLQITGAQDLELRALHEFGHVAGLIHEHEHENAISDRECDRLRISTGVNFTVDAYYYAPYDKNSIMNYCSTASKRLEKSSPLLIELTASDTKTLRCIYIRNQMTQPESCSKF